MRGKPATLPRRGQMKANRQWTVNTVEPSEEKG